MKEVIVNARETMPMLETWEEKAGYLLCAVEYISVPRNTIPVSSNNEIL
jgi:hypothetical protein